MVEGGTYKDLYLAVPRNNFQKFQEMWQMYGEECRQRVRDGTEINFLVFSLYKNCVDQIVNFLIDDGEDVNSRWNDWTPLYFAIKHDRTNIIHKLLECGADVNGSTSRGYGTHLHHAVKKGNLENVCMLLYYGASVNEEDDYKQTPFELALLQDHYSIVMSLIDYVDDINRVDKQGYSCFHRAICSSSDNSIALEIIARGGDVNIPWHGIHPVLNSIRRYEDSEIFEAVWSRIDYEVFLECDNVEDFMRTVVDYCKFPADQYLNSLYMILSSPHAGDFFNHFWQANEERKLLRLMMGRDIPLAHKTDLFWIFLSYGEELSFDDISYLYDNYGFEVFIHAYLSCGCHIYRDIFILPNPMITNILYNSMEIYDYVPNNVLFSESQHLKIYSKFYKNNCEWTDKLFISKEEFLDCRGNNVKSLLQICRDAVREVVYNKIQGNDCAFKAFHALGSLPVPSAIKDVLYLRRPIY